MDLHATPTRARMDRGDVETILAGCEAAFASGARVDLGELGFWHMVAAVKRSTEWTEQFADRIGDVDQRAFRRAVWPIVPLQLGTAALSIGALAGLATVSLSRRVPPEWRGPVFLAGTGMLVATTHGLAHFAVGSVFGIRFTSWFLGGPTKLQPGLKTDYASYLRTPPYQRAAMHAAGALATKLVPFALIPAARRAQTPPWTAAILLGFGAIQIATDMAFSVRVADWKRFFRERRVAREMGPTTSP